MGAQAGLRHARKHLAAYANHANGQDPERSTDRLRLVTTEKLAEAKALLASFFDAAEHVPIRASRSATSSAVAA
jgi:hypothetical protein